MERRRIPDQHLEAARGVLSDVRIVTDQPGGDAQVKATAAVAEAVLALAEEVSKLRTEINRAGR